MPYKLRFDGGVNSGKIVTLPASLTLSSLAAGSSCRVEVDFDLNVVGADQCLLFDVSNYSFLRILPSGVIRAGYTIQSGFGDIVDSSAQTLVAGTRYTLSFDLSETRKVAELRLNGVLIGSASNRWGTYRIKDVGIWSGSSALNGHIYEIRQYQNGVLTGRQSAENVSSGTVLPDVVGSNSMNQAGTWPSNNSEWVFYDAGGATTSAISATWPMFSASAAQSQSLPSVDSAIAAAWPMFSASASQSQSIAGVSSGVAAAWPMLSASAGQSQSIPSATSIVSAQWPIFSASATQSQSVGYASSVALTWPMFTASAAQSQSIPSVSATVAAQWPMFAAAAEQSQSLSAVSSAVSATWPMFATSALQSSTAPVYSVSVSSTWPMFSTRVTFDGIQYYTDTRAELDILRQSRQLDVELLSRTQDIRALSRTLDITKGV